MPEQTPSQTVGPFFSHALTPGEAGARAVATNALAAEAAGGAPIRIQGRVTDGLGAPVPDALIEIWQADHRGRQPDGSGRFRGFGRASTDERGEYWFRTVKPAAPSDGGAPHVSVAVFARGMLHHQFTRIYFADEREANAADALLASVPRDRRDTLVARQRSAAATPVYQFDIALQGDRETVFLDA